MFYVSFMKGMSFEQAASRVEILQSDVFASPLTSAALARLIKRAQATLAVSLLQMQWQEPSVMAPNKSQERLYY